MHGLDHVITHTARSGHYMTKLTLTRLTLSEVGGLKSFPSRPKTGALRLYDLVGTVCPISG